MDAAAAAKATARDAGDRPDRLAPDEAAGLRRCLVTRARRPRSGLVRFVVGPDGRITPDVAEKLPGRGLWLSARKDIIALAVAKGVFARAARQTVTVPDGLAQDVATLLAARCRAYLGLARNAGEAVLGFEQVKAWLEQGRAALLFEAGDGAEGGKAKLRRPALAARREAPGGSLPVFQCLTAAELGAAFGRDRAVHVAVGPGGLAGKIEFEARRLEGFRGPDDAREANGPGATRNE